MRILLLLCVAVAVAAAEVDAKALKALHAECAKRGALWTCLQLEEWGRQQKPELRLGPAMDGTTVTGSTLRALPEDIRLLVDLGERVVLTTSQGVHQCTADGRPLTPAWPWAMTSWDHCLGPQAAAIGAVTVHQPDKGGFRLQVHSLTLADGATVLYRSLEIQRDRRLRRAQAVAWDGSAIAVDLEGGDERAGPQAAMVITEEDVIHHPGVFQIDGVGPGGSWLLARNQQGLVAVAQGRPRPVRAAAHGAGCAVLLPPDGPPQLLRRDGSSADLRLGMALGNNPTCISLGGWLVLASGTGAVGVSETDLFGEGGGQPIEQPPTLALWRWEDLARDPAQKPRRLVAGELSVAWHVPAGLILWRDRQVTLLDLAAAEAQERPLYQAASPVVWAGIDKHLLLVDLGEYRREVVDAAGTVLWQGVAADLWVSRRDLLLTAQPAGDGRSYQVQTLAASEQERTAAPLALAPLTWNITVDAWRNRILASSDGQPWQELALDGTLRAVAQDPGQQPPATQGWDPPSGRFDRAGSRWFPKATGQPSELPQRLYPVDAWRFPTASGSALGLITDNQHVWFPGRKRGEWSDLGRAPTANRFGMAGKQPVVLSWERDLRIVQALAAGPTLVAPEQVPRLGQVAEMPQGPWRVDGWRFAVPGGREMVWDPARAGFAPVRLRSPDSGGLLVVTRSVVIDLDKDAVRLVGKTP